MRDLRALSTSSPFCNETIPVYTIAEDPWIAQ